VLGHCTPSGTGSDPVARGLTQWHGVCVQRMLANLLKYKKER